MKLHFFSATIFALALVSGCALAQNMPNPTQAVAPLPGGAVLIPSGLDGFKSYDQGPQSATAEKVTVEDQSFREALRLTTLATPPNYWDYGSTVPLLAPVKKGDVLWVSLWVRRLTTFKESGEAQFEVALLQKVGEREVRPLERIVSFGSNWTQFTIPFTVKNDSEVGQVSFGVRFGYGKQSVEVGGFQLLNYGPNVKLIDLPLSKIRYDGWAANAPWRRAAAERIEKHRKGDLVVRVVDENGKPVSGAQVQVRMKRHAFTWGTEVDDVSPPTGQTNSRSPLLTRRPPMARIMSPSKTTSSTTPVIGRDGPRAQFRCTT